MGGRVVRRWKDVCSLQLAVKAFAGAACPKCPIIFELGFGSIVVGLALALVISLMNLRVFRLITNNIVRTTNAYCQAWRVVEGLELIRSLSHL